MTEMRLYIYTDAPPIGEATVPMHYLLSLVRDEKEKGSEREKEDTSVTSNQKGATLETMIAAITRIKDGNQIPLTVVCHCPNDFMIAVNRSYYTKWSRNGWKNSKGTEVEHADKWQRLCQLFKDKLPEIYARAPRDDEIEIMRNLGAKAFIPHTKLT